MQYLNVCSVPTAEKLCLHDSNVELYSFNYYIGSEWKKKKAVQDKDLERHVGECDISACIRGSKA